MVYRSIDAASTNGSARKDDVPRRPRALTHDEMKAAEAAFRLEPFQSEWSQAARRVYDGITAAVMRLNRRRMAQLDLTIHSWDD
jgi:hypothetical protein